MNRYSYNTIRRTKDGNEYYATSRTAYISPEINDVYIISKRGDRLEMYANEYYKDVTKWTYIARANSLGKGTTAVAPNLQIRIPMNVEVIRSDDADLNL